MADFVAFLDSSGAATGTCLDPLGVLDPLCPEPRCDTIYRHHVDCYRECCCSAPFIAFPAFLAMCEAPFPCSFVKGTISVFNACT
jgi:hypothetical protein